MNLEIYAIIISALTFLIALLAAAFTYWQVALTRKALKNAEDSFRLSTQIRQLNALDKMHFVITAQNSIESWIKT
jgi:Flp pilus assembly protein TadB